MRRKKYGERKRAKRKKRKERAFMKALKSFSYRSFFLSFPGRLHAKSHLTEGKTRERKKLFPCSDSISKCVTKNTKGAGA